MKEIMFREGAFKFYEVLALLAGAGLIGYIIGEVIWKFHL